MTEREKAIQRLQMHIDSKGCDVIDCPDGYCPVCIDAYKTAIEALKEEPIIHCAECEYYSTNGQKDCNGNLLYYCGRYSGADYVEENSFCSWAERREE